MSKDIVENLLAYEMDSDRPTDGRRVIRDERLSVLALRQTKGANATATKNAEREAARVLALWS